MPKEIILYNLCDAVSEKEYLEYVEKEKGPFLVQLPAARSFTLLRVSESLKGVIPYEYVGILEYTDAEAWKRDCATEAFGNFMKKWSRKVKPDFQVLQGTEAYYLAK